MAPRFFSKSHRSNLIFLFKRKKWLKPISHPSAICNLRDLCAKRLFSEVTDVRTWGQAGGMASASGRRGVVPAPRCSPPGLRRGLPSCGPDRRGGLLSGRPAHFLSLSFSRAQDSGGEEPLSCRPSPRLGRGAGGSRLHPLHGVACLRHGALLSACFWPEIPPSVEVVQGNNPKVDKCRVSHVHVYIKDMCACL